jgi:preprotein translocase YajC subunit
MEILEILKFARQGIPFIVLVVAFTSLIIWPQYQHRHLQNKLSKQLKIGIKVLMNNGTIGTVLLILEKSIIVEMFDGSRVEILKLAIKDVIV